jgi:hypothetical protein
MLSLKNSSILPEDREELKSRTTLNLLEKYERNPETRLKAPWSAIKFALGDAIRSHYDLFRDKTGKTVSRMDHSTEAYDKIESMVIPPNQLCPTFEDRLRQEDEVNLLAEAWEKFKHYGPAQRYQQECETREALLSSPLTMSEWEIMESEKREETLSSRESASRGLHKLSKAGIGSTNYADS